MKYLFLTLVIISATALLTGCGGKSASRLHPYGWPALQPEFDSLTLEAEQLYIDRHADSLSRVIRRMREIADKNPRNRQMTIRTTYWEGRFRFTTGDIEGGTRMLERALAMTDSASYPYERHRILWNLDMDYHSPSIERYDYLLSELDFFIKAGDLMMAADYCMELGAFLNNVEDTENGIPYLMMADSLLRLANQPDQVSNNRINHADALRIKGDTIKAARLLREILADSVTPISPYARDIVLGNLYGLTGDTLSLREAYDIVKDDPMLFEAKCTYENYFTEEALHRDDLPMAKAYHALAASEIPDVEDPKILVEFLRLKYNIFQREGEMDSAYHYLYLASQMSEEINSSDRELQIRNANLARKIAERKLQADIDRRRSTIMQLSVTFALLLTVVAGGVFFYRRLQRQKLERVNDTLKLERSNRRMMAMELLMKEKENLFQSVETEMNELSEKGEISRKAASRIASSLKAHSGTKAERDGFMETFEQLDPAFSREMRQSHPQLTEADIRLAAFIALGMDNKHIARVMAIRPESVKQARWRLRSKMGLSPGASLEEAVRAFASRK